MGILNSELDRLRHKISGLEWEVESLRDALIEIRDHEEISPVNPRHIARDALAKIDGPQRGGRF